MAACDGAVKCVLVAACGQFVGVANDFLRQESAYVQGLRSSGMKDADLSTLHLPALSARGLLALQEYAETREVQFQFDEAEDVVEAASYLQMEALLDACISRLQALAQPTNYYPLLKLAEQFSLGKLAMFIEQLICANFKEFAQTLDYKELHTNEICKWLGKDNIYAKNEYEIFTLAMKWFQKKSPSILSQILACIRFPLMTATQLDQCEATLHHLNLFQPGQDYIQEARRFLAGRLPLSLHLLPKQKRTPRCGQQYIVASGGFTSKEKSSRLVQMIPLAKLISTECSGQVEESPRTPPMEFQKRRGLQLPHKLCEHCSVVLNGWLYVVGGQRQYEDDGKHTGPAMSVLCPWTLKWHQLESMSTPRSLFCLAALDTCLYAIGGWTAPDRVTRTVERYDTRTGGWEYVRELQIGLHEHAGCAYGGKLYVSGGYRGPQRGHLNRVFSYHPASDTWQEKAPILNNRSYHQMVAVGERLLLFGGVNYVGDDTFEDVLACESYCPASDQWSLISRLPVFGCCMPSVVVDDRYVLLFGGYSFPQERSHSTCQIYDAHSGQWRALVFRSNGVLSFAMDLMDIPRNALQQDQIDR